jgi:hypothetical protein
LCTSVRRDSHPLRFWKPQKTAGLPVFVVFCRVVGIAVC